MIDLAGRVRGLRGVRRFALAFLLGALGAAALAPLHLVPVLLVSFTGLVWLLDGSRSGADRFFAAWAFGWGHFIAGLYWIGHAFLVDAAQFGWLLPFPVLGLPAVAALYPALAIAVMGRFRLQGFRRILGLALAWTVAEYARGYFFTGFPWNLLGYAWSFSEALIQIAAVIGVYGMGLLTVLLAALPARLGDSGLERRRHAIRDLALAGLALALVWGAGRARLAGAETAEIPGVRLRLVQANISQKQKLDEFERARNFERQLALSEAAGAAAVTHWIWPETAVPYFVEFEPARLQRLRDLVGPGRFLLTGVVRRTAPGALELKVWNSLQVITGSGIIGSYDKQHLVPFGEYLPVRDYLKPLGLSKLTQSTVDFSAGQGDPVLRLPGLPPVQILICYEGIFPGEIRSGEQGAAWLLNVTNDGWFGLSSGPHQHFAMERMRAVEQGVPMVRSANTGISAVIDPYGRVLQSLGLDQAGVIDSGLPAALGQRTIYARFGERPTAFLMLLAVASLVARRPTQNLN